MLRQWCIGGAALGLGALLFASSAAAAPEAEPDPGAADAGDEAVAEADDDGDVDADDGDDGDLDEVVADDASAEVDAAATADADAVEGGDPSAPMVEVIPKDKKVRHDWYVGFGLGSGIGFGSVEAGNTLGLDAISGVKVASSGFIHGGGRLREKVYLGARIANLTGGPAGATSLMAEALFFPIKERGLLLGVAVGPSVLYAVSTDDSAGPSGMRQNGRPALGVAADIAYDFWILRRFNLGVVLQGNGALNPNQAMIFGTTLGLQFNWY